MEKTITAEDILTMDTSNRRNFGNTLSGIKNVQLLGTQSLDLLPNLGLFSSVVHIGANPACLGFIMRPLTVARQTYQNIKSTGYYTLNQVHRGILEQAHQASAKYPDGISEFEETGLTPQYSSNVSAPYVAEAFIKIGLEFTEEHHIKTNDSWLIVGRIIEVILPEDSIGPEGHLDTAAWDGIGVSGLDTYYDLKKITRFPFARPKKPKES